MRSRSYGRHPEYANFFLSCHGSSDEYENCHRPHEYGEDVRSARFDLLSDGLLLGAHAEELMELRVHCVITHDVFDILRWSHHGDLAVLHDGLLRLQKLLGDGCGERVLSR